MTPGRKGVFTPAQARLWACLAGPGTELGGYAFVGGTALAEFYLGHRRSDDFDLFTARAEDLAAARRFLRAAAPAAGFSVEEVRATPTFLRYLVVGGGETVRVDFALDAAYAEAFAGEAAEGAPPRIPRLETLAAMKVATVLHRSDLKDLIDLFFIRADAPGAFAAGAARAEREEGGLTPEALGWSIGEIAIPAAPPPYMLRPLDLDALGRFRDSWAEDLRRRALGDRPPT